MNNPNEHIDRVLTHLNNTATPTGLEHRILEGIHTRTSHLTPRTWSETLQFFAAAPWPRAGVAACATAAIALFLFMQTSHSKSAHHQSEAQNPPAPHTAFATAQDYRALPPAIAERQRRALYQPGATPQVHSANNLEGLKARSIAAAPSTPEDTLALAETQAPSLPSPTLPLTPDERRMQTAVRHSELPQLAELHTPDPSAIGVAPIFAGFASRPEENPTLADSDITPIPDNDTITTGDTQ